MMLKQIQVKSMNSTGSMKRMYDEAQAYLENIGFTKSPIMSVTDENQAYRSFLFAQGFEKVLIEYKKDMHEEVLKLVFNPLQITFIYDILLMRFNQLAREEHGSVFIYNS